MTDSAESQEHPLLMIAVWVIFLASIVILISAWYVSVFFLVSAYGALFLSDAENLWGKATLSFLSAVAIGTGIVSIAQVALNWGTWVEASWVESAETGLIELAIVARSLLSWDLTVFLVVMGLLVAINYVIPQVRAVSGFISLHNLAGKCVAVLIAGCASYGSVDGKRSFL